MSWRKRNCVLCGSTKKIEEHHVGGKAFDFTLPLCHQHHVTITVGLKRLKIDTSIKAKHLIHALRATIYFLWMLVDRVGNEDSEHDRKA